MRRMAVATGLVVLAFGAVPASAQQRTAMSERDRPLTDRPTPAWSVGSAEGDSWELLSNVRAAVFDANDNLYALDTGNHRVLVFDRSGAYVRSIGKQGGGPGEFQFPMSLAITADGKLVVGEGRGFNIFRTDGTFERLVPSGSGLGGMSFDAFGVHPEGGVIARTRAMPQPGDAAAAEGARMAAPIVRFGLREGETPDTILPLTEPMPTVRDMPGQGGRRMRMITISGPTATFARPMQWVVLPDGRVAVAEETDAYEIRLAADGSYTRTLTRAIQPRTPSERDRERAREERRESLKAGGNAVRVSSSGGNASFSFGAGGPDMTEEQIRENIAGMTFAERIPVIQDLFADANGRLWVERAPRVWGDPAPVDLIAAADGRYIGTIEGIDLPLATSRSGLGMWVEKDELEVEKIVVRRLPASWN